MKYLILLAFLLSACSTGNFRVVCNGKDRNQKGYCSSPKVVKLNTVN